MQDRIVRAVFDESSVIVYQAFNGNIANLAIRDQTFVSPPFKKERMTWIKPSFLWMMYRSGWAKKENQEHILSIKLTRTGFDWALKNSCLTFFDQNIFASKELWEKKLNESPVKIQWDPEKDIYSKNLLYKTVQIGLSGIAVEKYLSDWIIKITDITDECKYIHGLISINQIDKAKDLIPKELVYPLPLDILEIIGSTFPSTGQ